MDQVFANPPPGLTGHVRRPISGTYCDQCNLSRLELRVDIPQYDAPGYYQSLDLVGGDFFQEASGEQWDCRTSFINDHGRKNAATSSRGLASGMGGLQTLGRALTEQEKQRSAVLSRAVKLIDEALAGLGVDV